MPHELLNGPSVASGIFQSNVQLTSFLYSPSGLKFGTFPRISLAKLKLLPHLILLSILSSSLNTGFNLNRYQYLCSLLEMVLQY
jgi:hypothetical protein